MGSTAIAFIFGTSLFYRLLLLPALCRSILLVASNSRQLNNSIPALSSGGRINKYEFRSRHSASHSSKPNSVPINNVRMTLVAFLIALAQQARDGRVPFVFIERQECLTGPVLRRCLR